MTESEKKQIDLNLAINFMVIERVLHCREVYQLVCDEHQGLDGIIELSKNFELQKELNKLEAAGELQVYLDEYTELFDLSEDILTGREQFDLGVIVDPKYNALAKLSEMPMEELNDYVEDSGMFYIPWFADIESVERINNSIGKGIGKIKYTGSLKNALEQAKYNPVGINILGLITGLINHEEAQNLLDSFDGKADENEERLESEIADFVNKTFSYIGVDEVVYEDKELLLDYEKQEYARTMRYAINWQDNIYSLDSIIYSFLRLRNRTLEWYKRNGKKEHKFYDNVSADLPYPLNFVDENSGLLNLIAKVIAMGHEFSVKYTELVRVTTIETEIKRYENKIVAEQKKQATIDKNTRLLDGVDANSNDDEKAAAYKNIVEYQIFEEDINNRIKDYEEYIITLKNHQVAFNEDCLAWLNEYVIWLNKQKLDIDEHIQSMQKLMKESQKDFEYYQLLSKQRMLEDRLYSIDECIRMVNVELKKRSKKEVKQYILVKEPYYESVGLSV